MESLIDISCEAVARVFKLLLVDKTTKKNIIWATDTYEGLGEEFSDDKQMDAYLLRWHADIIRPRIEKSLEAQAQRTRKKAEVFTPAWLCNKMNNALDDDWFGRENVFNTENDDHTWTATEERIEFPTGKSWQSYVDSRRLEITCGEAPYLVSRYDVSTGEIIPVGNRIGILDRKLRVVDENTENDDDWLKWTMRAFESVYGYEYQGDNVLIARINLLLTFVDYYRERMGCEPSVRLLEKMANKISWNIWQMDGLKCTVPLGKANEDYKQLTLFDVFGLDYEMEAEPEAAACIIKNWRGQKTLKFMDLKERAMGKKLFDYVIGNPPYQDESTTNNRAEAIYPYFYDAAEMISDNYMLISPARFLFNAGLTSKEWNKKMLTDEHLKVVYYNGNSSEVFPNTDIKGGVAVVYRSAEKEYGAIEDFVPDEVLRSISVRFKNNQQSLSDIMFGGRSDLKFNDLFLRDYPNSKNDRLLAIQAKHPSVMALGPNEEYELKSPTLEVLQYAFGDNDKHDRKNYYKILGLVSGKRVYRWIERKYMDPRYPDNNNIDKYKVFIPKASGTGTFGEILSAPVVAEPGDSSTPTFISIGSFDTELEAINTEKYIKTKFSRALLGVLKITQDIVPSKWKYVPLQDFTPSSDIDWSKSIPEIDRQLYAKYGLDEKEIEFIETHVKEMV